MPLAWLQAVQEDQPFVQVSIKEGIRRQMRETLLEMWKFHGWALLAGCIADWILGDPRHFPHPVRLMGSMIAYLEGVVRTRLKGRERLGGCILVLTMCLVWTVIPFLLFKGIRCLEGGSPGKLLFLAETFVCYQLLAAKDLCAESMKVLRSLKNEGLAEARRAVSMIVGRDTAVLDEAGVARAAVETVAENASDGVIAPFFYMALFGPVGGCIYKAVNTMDSMVGYTNEKYRELGWAAAKLDDAVNLIPARLTGLLLVLAAWIAPWADGRRAWTIFLRDRRNHKSPNSAHGEAACAGALGLRLAGDAWYFGELHKKPFIGDDIRPVEPEDIRRANCLMFLAQAMLMLLIACLLLLA